jgi:hypothetical protein
MYFCLNTHRSLLLKFRFILSLIFLSLIMMFWGPIHAAEYNNHHNVGSHFLNESLAYNVSFFPFPKAAGANFSFKPEPGVKEGYVATLDAKVSSLVKLLLFRNMSQKIVSHVVLSPDGKRLVSRKFENITIRGGKVYRQLITEYDYENHTVNWQKWKKGKLTAKGTHPIPEGVYYDDPLCAFYNMRFGVYGPVEPGKIIDVKTCPDKKEKRIRLYIANKQETLVRKRQEKEYANREYLVKIQMDDDLFESRDGDIEIWFDKNNIPLEAVVRGVILLGDVRGQLKSPDDPVDN